MAADPQAVTRAAAIAERVQRETRDRALRISLVMRETARTLERTAALAEEHARRRDRVGGEGAVQERQAAERAREAARRARRYAQQWRDVADGGQP